MHAHLLDLTEQPLTTLRLDVTELPGAILYSNRVFFRWQDATYRETAVHHVPAATEQRLLVNAK
ncbi:MAG: hypothetical protein RBJ76_13350 [Stenomitos frigidus ULC029]